jgi:glycosyltransferase involved in cell wall biosynthesis
VRVLLDYRPALRERTGVGEYVHQLARALAHRQPAHETLLGAEAPSRDGPAVGCDEITLFSSSLRDRLLRSDARDVGAARTIDLRWPVSVLNLSWHRLGWPPIELMTGERFDVVHSPHPLLLPTRTAAQVVTIHDLYFLFTPERVRAEIRRDYGAMAADHARRADRIVVPSMYTAVVVESKLGVPGDRISVCPEGVPDWPQEERPPRGERSPGYILFMGTLEARKNVPGLLAAYGKLLARHPDAPGLVLAGRVPAGSESLLAGADKAPLAGRVEHLGYVPSARRRALYEDAAMLVLPSFDEGFGLPALEAMSLGIPVVASNRGALPEVVADAGLLADPADPEAIAAAMATVLTDAGTAAALAERGVQRARMFSWARCASLTREAYMLAIATRAARQARAASSGAAKA